MNCSWISPPTVALWLDTPVAHWLHRHTWTGGEDHLTTANLGYGGTLTAETAAVPAPLVGRGLPVALAFAGILFAAKLLQRSRKPRSLGTQRA